MEVKIIWGPEFVTEALFGVGLSFGLTSGIYDVKSIEGTPMYERLMKVARGLAHKPGGGHNKFLETIMFSLDVKAPRYWWQEFDMYRVGVTKQSESTMHTIMKRPLTSDDFEGNFVYPTVLNLLKTLHNFYLQAEREGDRDKKEHAFMYIKSVLPEGFLQRRIVCLNAKSLKNMYEQRKNHRLPEWREFFDGIFVYLMTLSDDDVESAFVRYCIFGDGNDA